MGAVHIYHPVTDATVAVPEEAVPHYRQSGWLLRSEWDENQAAAAAAAEQQAASDAKAAKTAPKGN